MKSEKFKIDFEKIMKIYNGTNKTTDLLLKRQYLKKLFFSLLTSLIPAFAIALSLSLLIQENDGSFLKDEIKINIEKAVMNGADLRAIKNIYDNRKLTGKSIIQKINPSEKYYTKDTSLIKILEDIRSDQFLKESNNNKIYLKINKIIDEHLARNPFDSLEPNQKDYFLNIQIKSAEKYSILKVDIDKIASELENKNALVNKYLNTSNISFWISVIALVLSLGIGSYQIYQNSSPRLQKDMAIVLSKYLSENKEKE